MDVLSTILLIAHLLCVNVAAGGPILCVWLEWWRGDAVARLAAAYLGRMSLVVARCGQRTGRGAWLVAFGRPPIAHSGPGRSPTSCTGERRSWSFRWCWRCCTGSSCAGRAARRLARGWPAAWSRSSTGRICSITFPSLFVVAGKLADAGVTTGEAIRGAEFRRLAWTGEAPALAIHVILASVAVAGVMLLGLALRWQRHDESPADIVASPCGAAGGRWGRRSLQLPIGLWTLAVLPAEMQSTLMGSHMLGTTLFIAAMLAVFWLLRDLAGWRLVKRRVRS